MARSNSESSRLAARLVGENAQTFQEVNRSLRDMLSAMDDISESSGKDHQGHRRDGLPDQTSRPQCCSRGGTRG